MVMGGIIPDWMNFDYERLHHQSGRVISMQLSCRGRVAVAVVSFTVLAKKQRARGQSGKSKEPETLTTTTYY